ncbi:hypothetical protein C8Q73DRAFT_461490 [Cubamyces lactineus]|nr:hypothetical protein C8Q73DRAFT_461490 [Cubamyces lactineus]
MEQPELDTVRAAESILILISRPVVILQENKWTESRTSQVMLAVVRDAGCHQPTRPHVPEPPLMAPRGTIKASSDPARDGCRPGPAYLCAGLQLRASVATTPADSSLTQPVLATATLVPRRTAVAALRWCSLSRMESDDQYRSARAPKIGRRYLEVSLLFGFGTSSNALAVASTGPRRRQACTWSADEGDGHPREKHGRQHSSKYCLRASPAWALRGDSGRFALSCRFHSPGEAYGFLDVVDQHSMSGKDGSSLCTQRQSDLLQRNADGRGHRVAAGAVPSCFDATAPGKPRSSLCTWCRCISGTGSHGLAI